LTHLYVAPAHWGRGAATELLDASRAKAERLQLWVFQRNRAARHFYSRRGFQDCELTDGQGNEEKMPDLRMVWHRAR
jgi:GNAT superfamily N-acetyltransferase